MSTKPGFETGESAVIAEVAQLGEKLDMLIETIGKIFQAIEKKNSLTEKILSIAPPVLTNPVSSHEKTDTEVLKQLLDHCNRSSSSARKRTRYGNFEGNDRAAKKWRKFAEVISKIIQSSEVQLASETPFPWGDDRVSVRAKNPRHWREGRPETFEELIKIGRSQLHVYGNDHCRNIGIISIHALDPIFEEHGFGERWMKS